MEVTRRNPVCFVRYTPTTSFAGGGGLRAKRVLDSHLLRKLTTSNAVAGRLSRRLCLVIYKRPLGAADLMRAAREDRRPHQCLTARR